jgi:carbonic anhydrase/acetyltransferase-like protein (isoleucine patch superfamily)
MIIPVNGIYPKIHPSVWIAPTATIIGDVEIGEGSSIWFNTVIRGDVFPMRIGREVNIQDNCTLHGTYKKCGVVIHDRVTVGHQVILHGCEIAKGTLIGMGCIIMDNAFVGEGCLVGAGSLLTEEASFREKNQLIVGRPAKPKRALSDDEIKHVSKSADNYILYSSWYAGHGGKIP